MTLPRASSPLLPYTTLFRSTQLRSLLSVARRRSSSCPSAQSCRIARVNSSTSKGLEITSLTTSRSSLVSACCDTRSEEHTSELQSPCNLVCRLLLEKHNRNV